MNRICSAIISFPAIAYWRSITSVYCPYECDFTDDILYLIFSSLVSFYIPLTVMIVVYIRIYRAATRQINALKSGQKLNVKSADGTPLTLRIHRGKYHGIQFERKNVNTDNTNPVVKASYQENKVSKKCLIKSKTDVIRTKMETNISFNTTNILSALSLSFTNLTTFMISSNSDTNKFESFGKASNRDKITKLRRFSCPSKIIYDLVKLDRNTIQNLVKDGEKLKNLPLNIWQGLTLANNKRFWRQRTISLLYYPSLSNEFNQPSAFYLKNQTFTKLRSQRQNATHYNKNESKNSASRLSKLEEEESNLSNSFESTCNPISNISSIQNDSVISINNANNWKTESRFIKPFDQTKEPSMQSFDKDVKTDYDDDEYAKIGLTNNLLFYQQHYYEHSLTRIKEKNNSKHIFSKFVNFFTNLFSKHDPSCKVDKSSQDSTKPIIFNKNKTRINLFKSKQQIKALGLAKKKLNKFSTEQKAAKTLGIVMGVFMICWLPFFILNVFTGISKTTLPDHEVIFAVFTWLGYLNSGCNPIIYAFSSRDFRRAFLKILCPAKFLKKVKETTKSEYYNACNNFTSNASSTNNSYAFKIETKATKPKVTCHLCQVYEERLSKQPNEFEKNSKKSKGIDKQIDKRKIILNSSHLDLETNKCLVVNLDHQISCSSLAKLNSQNQASSLSFSSITRNIRRRFQINSNRRKSPNTNSFQRSNSVTSSSSLSLLRNVSVNNYRTNSSAKASVLNYSDLRNISQVPIGTKFNFKQNFILQKSNCVNNFSYKTKNSMSSCDNDNCVAPRLFPKSFLVAVNSKQIARKRPRKRIYSFTSNKSQHTNEL